MEKSYLSNSGLLRLGTGCTARTKCTTLTGTTINKRTEEYIYYPNFTFNITGILPKLDTIQQLPQIKPFTWEKSHIGKWKRLQTDESLSTIEEQLTEFEEQNFNKQLHNKYWTEGSSAIIIIIIIIMIYFGKNSILKCLKNQKRTPKKEEALRELQYLQPVNIPEIRVQTENSKIPIRNIRIV